MIKVSEFLAKKAKGNFMCLDTALECLNELIDDGMEYPAAEVRVLAAFGVLRGDLDQAYCQQ